MDRIDSTLRECEKLAQYIAILALHLHYAEAGKKEGKDSKEEVERIKEQAKEQLYYRLDVPFRDWLRSLEPSQGEERQQEWHETARRIAEKMGRDLVEQAGPAAFRGRYVKSDEDEEDEEDGKGKKSGKSEKDSKEKKKFYSAPKEFNIFMSCLKKWGKRKST